MTKEKLDFYRDEIKPNCYKCKSCGQFLESYEEMKDHVEEHFQ